MAESYRFKFVKLFVESPCWLYVPPASPVKFSGLWSEFYLSLLIFLPTIAGFCPVRELKNAIVSLAFASSSVSIFTYLFKSSICLSLGSSFLIGLLEIKEALDA